MKKSKIKVGEIYQIKTYPHEPIKILFIGEKKVFYLDLSDKYKPLRDEGAIHHSYIEPYVPTSN